MYSHYNIDMSKYKKLLTLFKTTFIVSLTANSGYAILSELKTKFVTKYKWISEEKMNDYIALAQSCPGPMAISCSTIVGYEIAGYLGAFISVLGCIIPPIIIMVIVSYFYQYIIQNIIVAIFMKGMSFGVVAMLLDVLIGLFTSVTKKGYIYPIALIIFSFLYIKFVDATVFFLVIICIICALIKAKYTKEMMGENK